MRNKDGFWSPFVHTARSQFESIPQTRHPSRVWSHPCPEPITHRTPLLLLCVVVMVPVVPYIPRPCLRSSAPGSGASFRPSVRPSVRPSSANESSVQASHRHFVAESSSPITYTDQAINIRARGRVMYFDRVISYNTGGGGPTTRPIVPPVSYSRRKRPFQVQQPPGRVEVQQLGGGGW